MTHLTARDNENVIGVSWQVAEDSLAFGTCKGETTVNQITKRRILSVVNSIFDPLGLLSPFTVKPKILLRQIWATLPKIDWDDKLPEKIEEEWRTIAAQMKTAKSVKFRRSLTPKDAQGLPILIVFSDGSKEAYGAAAYCRWKVSGGGYKSTLIIAKTRIAPLKIIDIVRLEMCGAVISTRIRSYIQQEMEMEFERVYHIVDSEIVKAMIDKDSYGFNTFAANRIGEIHRGTMKHEWYWVSGKLNVSDLTTRGCSPEELGEDSIWQRGPEFLGMSEEEWPVRSDTSVIEIPEMKIATAYVGVICEVESLASRIDVSRFSKWTLLQHTTARVMKLYVRFKTGGNRHQVDVLPVDLQRAEEFWIKEAQRKLHGHLHERQYVKLIPTYENGIAFVGGRTERWMNSTWNKQKFVLMPKDDPVSLLIIRHEHAKSGHLGTAATVSRIRSKYWIIGVRRSVRSVVDNCIRCKSSSGSLHPR